MKREKNKKKIPNFPPPLPMFIECNRKGYTVVELMVSVAIFALAMTLATGAFVKSLRTERAVNELASLNSNASLVLEAIAREIRTGYDFTGSDRALGCVTPQGDTLQFTSASRGNTVIYRWNKDSSGSIEREECEITDCTSAVFETLTDENMAVTKFCTHLVNENVPRVTVLFSMGLKDNNAIEKEVHFQTTISSRVIPNLDL